MKRYTVELDGVRYVLEGDHPPTEDEARAAIGDGGEEADASLPGYERARRETETGIKQRPSAIKNMQEQMADPAQFAKEHPIQTALTPLRAGAAAFEAAESVPANIGLALQRGDLTGLPEELMQGVTGERPAEIGDVFRASDVPVISSEPFAAGAGLLLSGPKMNPVAKGMDKAGQMAGKAMAPVGRAAVKPITDIVHFPYNKTLEVQKGLLRYYRNANKTYGKRFDRIARGVKGPIDTKNLLPALQGRLQQWGLLDQTGVPLQGVHPDFGGAKDEVLRVYEKLRTTQYVTLREVVDDMRAIRNSIRASARLTKNSPIVQSERLAGDMLRDLGIALEPVAPGLAKLNKDHAKKMNFFRDANNIFKVFKGEYNTQRGEAALGRIDKLNQGTKNLISRIEHETGLRILKPAESYAGFKRAAQSIERIPFAGQVPGIVAGVGQGVASMDLEKAIGSPSAVVPQLGLAGMREAMGVTNLEGEEDGEFE